MTNTILTFCERLLPLRRDGVALFTDESHRITVRERAGNPVFALDALVAGDWHPMSTIELEVGTRHFWTRVVEVLRCFTGATFALPDGLVAAVAVGLPGAESLTQERARDSVLELVVEPRAGAKQPDFEGTIRSTRRTKTRGDSDYSGGSEDEDVFDVID